MFSNQSTVRKKLIIVTCVLCWWGSVGLASNQVSVNLLITEVALHNREFIEIYNPLDQDVNLSEYWFCYYPSNRVSWELPWRSKQFPEEATIRSHSYFLLTLGDDDIGRDLLTDWNVYLRMMLDGDGGTVAILNGSPGKGEIVDAVGWGTAKLARGTASVESPESRSLARTVGTSRDAPFLNTGDNATDFHHALPAPSSARSGIVVISDGLQTSNPMTETVEFSLFNASPTTRLFSIDTESEIGYTMIAQPTTLALDPGEWGQIEIRAKPYSFYVVDLETTGLDANECSIIEAAWVYVCDGEVVQSDSSLIFFEEPLDPFITGLTGITDEMLKAAPKLEDIIPSMLARFERKAVLSYSVNAFDRRFLEETAASLGLDMPTIQWIDVFRWAREAMPDLPSHSLQAVAEYLCIEGGHHRALSDSLVTNQVFQEAVTTSGKSALCDNSS